MRYVKVIICGLAVVLILVAFSTASQPTSRAVPARELLPDSGRQLKETNAKLDKVNQQLALLNSKLQAIYDLLGSGKIQVVVKGAGGRDGEGN